LEKIFSGENQKGNILKITADRCGAVVVSSKAGAHMSFVLTSKLDCFKAFRVKK